MSTLELSPTALDDLAAEMPQECDYEAECDRSVEWEVVCRLCGGWGHLCSHHQAVVLERQRIHDVISGGTRCTACGGAGTELLTFSPVRSRDERKLW